MTNTVQAYSYASPSRMTGDRLGLSTSGGRTPSGPATRPRFFSGLVTQAAPAAAALLGLADVAMARYHRPRAGGGVWSRDPVVTCDGDRLRMESFSACGGVYARLDLLGGALDGEVFDRGTTNVDVNRPLREALARVGGRDPLHLGVGAEEMAVTTLDGAVVEKKVPLPSRWLRGFAEVQVIASGFDLRAELDAARAVRFLRGLPRKASANLWTLPQGRELRAFSPAESASGSPTAGAVCLSGVGRLVTLHPLLRFATALRVYGPPVSGHDVAPSAWELELPGMRYTLVLSPETWRGFSGEGAVLDDLSGDDVAADADVVGMLLNFEPAVEVGLLAERAGLSPARVRAALTQLGTAGRVGYDLAEAGHFHRELPYDREHVETLNPRLASARALVESGAVRVTGPDTAEVTTPGGLREVRLGDGSCTCEWWFDHRGSRGPCKHVLAARIAARVTEAVPR
ncbi:SWIM zinc finger family protein [Spongiactinospora sp. TRM90649]|uniref:SWIM zinc finger family protein n=1 Tax=Spongiactinospora sp. TRM90649 TaxID=3031114 RepID=UPI0023FA45AC|nr:SWIM zinc finger family protein [Spongiactinospora sp. TRM90649]MDF5755746.1 SWIM zinc finger domain-containing protein [Spongiactinospora sp. TRM90649]